LGSGENGGGTLTGLTVEIVKELGMLVGGGFKKSSAILQNPSPLIAFFEDMKIVLCVGHVKECDGIVKFYNSVAVMVFF
jgi:predicted sugar kinase